MMSLAEKIAFILSGKAEFARGGSRSAKGGKGSKSSKKAKGVTQGSKGGACCKTEGGKFAPGNNYGSLSGKGASAKTAANSAKAIADKATRAANVRVEATRRGAGPAAAIAARSRLAASKAGRVKAERDKAAAVAAKRAERNQKARERRAEKKTQAAAKPARDRAVGAMVEKSRAAVAKGAEVKAAKANPPIGKAIPKDAQVTAGFEAIPPREFVRDGRQVHFPGDQRFVVRRGDAALVVESGQSAIGVPARVVANYRKMGADGKPSPWETREVVAEFPNKRAAIDHAKAELARAVAVEPGGKIITQASSPPPKAPSTKGDRASAIKRATARSRVASGKAGAENAANKRADAETAARKARIAARDAANPPDRSRMAPGELDARWRRAGIQVQREGGRGPAAPVKPPPPAVERRPITDPVRLAAEVKTMDRAFDKAPGAKDNQVTLADLHKTMPHLSREEFVAVVRKGQDEGKYGLEPPEGNYGPPPPGAMEAAIVERGRYGDEPLRLVYIERRS